MPFIEVNVTCFGQVEMLPAWFSYKNGQHYVPISEMLPEASIYLQHIFRSVPFVLRVDFGATNELEEKPDADGGILKWECIRFQLQHNVEWQ